MRKIDLGLNPGGQPLTRSDAQFLMLTITELMQSLSRNNYNSQIILQGCVLSQGVTNWEMSSGYVICPNEGLTPEIFYVPGGDTGYPKGDANPQNNIYFNIDQEVSAPSPRRFHDLSIHNVHFTRNGIFNTTEGTIFQFGTFITQENLVTKQVASQLPGWVDVGSAGSPIFIAANFQSYLNTVRFRQNQIGQIILDGIIESLNIGNNLAIFQLPYVFTTTEIKLWTVNGGNNDVWTVELNPATGVLSIAGDITGTIKIALNQIPPFYLD
jgi:hypothetical protein